MYIGFGATCAFVTTVLFGIIYVAMTHPTRLYRYKLLAVAVILLAVGLLAKIFGDRLGCRSRSFCCRASPGPQQCFDPRSVWVAVCMRIARPAQ